MEIKSIGQSFEDVSVKEGIVTGYLSAFDIVDSDNDLIPKGAFARTIADWGPNGKKRIKHFLDHDNTKTIGVFTLLEENEKGLYYESKIGNHNNGVDFLKMVDSGIITEHSIGFKVIDKDTKSHSYTVLKEIKLYEGSSLQGHGANEYTPITGMKSLEDIERYFVKLEKALKSGTYTDETMLRIESYCKSLLPYFKTTQPDAQGGKTIVPDESKGEIEANLIIETFKKALNNGK